jgi:tRNA(His) 5'-end guanylyltransferase
MKLGFVEQILIQCFGMKLCFVEHKWKRKGLIIIRINKVNSSFNHLSAESSVASRSLWPLPSSG